MVKNCTSMISMEVCVGYFDSGRAQKLILRKICVVISNNFYQWTGGALASSPHSTQEREKLKFCSRALTSIA